jgi:hypothetical protein
MSLEKLKLTEININLPYKTGVVMSDNVYMCDCVLRFMCACSCVHMCLCLCVRPCVSLCHSIPVSLCLYFSHYLFLCFVCLCLYVYVCLCVFVYMCVNVYISYKKVHIHILLSAKYFVMKRPKLQEHTQAYVTINNNIRGYFFLSVLLHSPCSP